MDTGLRHECWTTLPRSLTSSGVGMTLAVALIVATIVVVAVACFLLWLRVSRSHCADARWIFPGKQHRNTADPTISAATADPRPLESSGIHLYRLTGLVDSGERHVGIVTGDLRRVRCADVWINSENTEMRMARVDEFSVSSIIRYEGARRDVAGRVIDDLIADELDRRVGDRRPVPAGAAIITGPGELRRFGVRYVVHVAAVHGEPGAGFRQIREVGRGVTNVLVGIDRLDDPGSVRSVLFPLLGTGQGGGELVPTIDAMVGAVVDYFAITSASRITTVYLLAYTDVELAACRAVCGANPTLHVAESTVDRIAVGSPRAVRPIVDTVRHGAAPPRNGSEPAVAGPNLRDESATEAHVVPRSARKALQMGFVLDVVGYSTRTAPAQEAVQWRLVRLLYRVLPDVGVEIDPVNHQWAGDGVIVFLPSDVDPIRTLSELVRSIVRWLAEDNRSHPDRIRLRMAVGVGIVGLGPSGFSGPAVIDISRLADSPQLRSAIAEHPDSDFGMLVCDYLYVRVIRPGYPILSAMEFERVEVTVKEFQAHAWLWVAPPAALDD